MHTRQIDRSRNQRRNTKVFWVFYLFDPFVLANVYVELVPQVDGGDILVEPLFEDLVVIGGLVVVAAGHQIKEVIHQHSSVSAVVLRAVVLACQSGG